MKVGICGFGWVGRAVYDLFKDRAEIVIYDPNKENCGTQEAINACDVAFVSVPTNMVEGGACDTSVVSETVDWLKTPLIIIRSTVTPGTTGLLADMYPDKNIVFQPEYIGETVAHPLFDEKQRNFIILGGKRLARDMAISVYKSVYNANVRILQYDATTAEVIKYMENSFIGTYVVFCNEFYEIANAFGVDYNEVREGFLADPRMTPYWTFVYQNRRGFDGKCIPKDMNAICHASRTNGYKAEFLEEVLNNNDRIKKYGH